MNKWKLGSLRRPVWSVDRRVGNRRIDIRVLVAMVVLLAGAPFPAMAQHVGPKNGSLVLVGGGRMAPEVYQRFIRLAGGRQASIVYIPTAAGRAKYGPDFAGRVLEGFMEQGATNLQLLHTNDRAEADSDAFVQAIRQAGGVFFGGGRQWRLADVYLGTKTEEALWGLLDRGGVIGGSSAGATIQGSYLARGDTKGNMIMMGDHEEGFGFLKNVAIDQHVLRRNRHFDLVEIIEARPGLLGIGLDEGAAIVVRGDEFEVLGGYTVIYDSEVMGGRGHFFFLSPGDRFDLVRRMALQSTTITEELWLPQVYETVEVATDILREYVGTYESPELSILISMVGDHLVLEAENLERRQITPLSESSFFDAATGQKLSFGRSDAGAVGNLVIGLGRTSTILKRAGAEQDRLPE